MSDKVNLRLDILNGSELAAIINGGADAQTHEAARVQAKALADGWLAN